MVLLYAEASYRSREGFKTILGKGISTLQIKMTSPPNKKMIFFSFLLTSHFCFSPVYFVKEVYHYDHAVPLCQHAMLIFARTHNRYLRCALFQADPYVRPQNITGKPFEGFCIDLMDLIAERQNFSVEYHMVENNNYGTINDKGVPNGMMKELMENVRTTRARLFYSQPPNAALKSQCLKSDRTCMK